VPVKKGKSITGKYFKDVVLKKLKKYYKKRRPVTGSKHIRLLHDNAPAHTSAIVLAYLEKKEKVTVLPHPRILQTLPHAEIQVPTGTWICHSSVPHYCAQISVP
jgi:hypothetical protein